MKRKQSFSTLKSTFNSTRALLLFKIKFQLIIFIAILENNVAINNSFGVHYELIIILISFYVDKLRVVSQALIVKRIHRRESFFRFHFEYRSLEMIYK